VSKLPKSIKQRKDTADKPQTKKRARQTKLVCPDIPSNISVAKKRLKLVEERIAEMSVYRDRLQSFVTQAENLAQVVESNPTSSELADAVFGRHLDSPNKASAASSSTCSSSGVVENTCASTLNLGTVPGRRRSVLSVASSSEGSSVGVIEDTSNLERALSPKTEMVGTRAGGTQPTSESSSPSQSPRLWRATCDSSKTCNVPTATFYTSVFREIAKETEENSKALPSMPAFRNMSESELSELMQESGMERGTKAYMEGELRRLWLATHQEHTSDSVNSKETAHGAQALAENELEQNVAICKAITSTMRNEQLYENILMSKCLNISDIQAAVKSEGVSVSLQKLGSFLDAHCVTYKAA